MKIHKTTKPLAYSYVENDRIYYIAELPHYGEISWSTELGFMLVTFSSLDEHDVEGICTTLLNHCQVARNFSEDPEFLLRVLGNLMSREGYAEWNSVVLLYLIAYLRILLDDEVDMRVLDFDDLEWHEGLLDFIQEDTTDHCLGAYSNISMLRESLHERQEVLVAALDQITESSWKDDSTLLQAQMKENERDEVFHSRWNTEFPTVCRAKIEEPGQYAQMTALYTIQDFLRHHLLQVLLHHVNITRCCCCMNYFIPLGRSDTIYCDRINSEYDAPCSKIGPQVMAQEKREHDPITRIYHRAYKRMHQRMTEEYNTFEEYDAWYQEARRQKACCEKGEITLKEFENWIDATSRQKKKTEK